MAYTFVKECEAYMSVENPIKVYFEKFQWNITYLDRGSPEFTVRHFDIIIYYSNWIHPVFHIDIKKIIFD